MAELLKLLFVAILVFSTAASFNVEPDINGMLDGVIESNTTKGDQIEARIIGGQTANRNRYPYFVRISQSGRLHCAGTLIHSDMVLTAAHCFSSGLTAIVNAYSTFDDNYQGQIFRYVESRIRHPSYDSRTERFDFLILKLASQVSGIQPIQLNDDSQSPVAGQGLSIIGVGVTQETGSTPSFLQQATVQSISQSVCNTQYNGAITGAVMTCAGIDGGGKDSCYGDSGGPLILQRDGVDVQVGVTSWGIGCARSQYPGVYSRVSRVKPWIDQVICQYSSDKPSHCVNISPPPVAASVTRRPFLKRPKSRRDSFSPAAPPSTVPQMTQPPAAYIGTAPSALQSQLDSNGTCDDAQLQTFYVNEALGNQRCVWLAARPEWQVVMCIPDHPSNAYSICEETCQKCSDNCSDTSSKFLIDEKERTCLWLSLRPDQQSKVCFSGQEAYRLCPETCESCHESTESQSLDISNNSTMQISTNLTSPEGSSQSCNDELVTTFWVSQEVGDQSCAWLALHQEWQEMLCLAYHPVGAYDICPETCGKCLDNNCQDSNTTFLVDDAERNCLWLSSAPTKQRVNVCVVNDSAYLACPKTCESCSSYSQVKGDNIMKRHVSPRQGGNN